MADGTAGRGPTLVLTFDLDKLAIGAGVTGLSSPLQKLLSQAPQGTQAALAWLPDLELSEAQTLLDFQKESIGAYVVVADADGNPLASTFVFITQDAGQPQAAVGLALDAPVDLAATPLFGTLLSGVRITDLGVTYATREFPEGAIVLPGGAPSPYPQVPSGFGLTVTVTANGSQQTFQLPPPDAAAPAASGTADAAARPGAAAAAAAAAPAVTWFDVQKSLGPLSVERVGLAAAGGTLGLAIDASLDTDVVSIQLTGFTVAFTPNAMTSAPPSVSLDGLAVAVDADPVQIAGALVRSQGPDGVEYDGALVIRTGSYGIDAAGSYTVLAGAPSLFVFGVADGPFGGPPAFFVTGLAAGFGVNRALRLPTISQLAAYPLIVAAGSSVVPPGTQGTQDALAQLNSGGWVPPTAGEYWVAAGVQFNSFELINGVLLATVEFGQDLVIALLGLASLRFPTLADAGDAGDQGPVYAYVEVALEAVLRPRDGVLSIEALLTPNSFVLDPACHLTGGLAFYSWFGGNPHAGDFVFTVGGYNEVFAVPAWYPSVPRLGFSWQLDDALAISGEAYFAVTPTAIMAGGRLSATFAAGGLRAWFIAQADFIVSWRPFWYDVEVSVSIGVSYTATIAFVSGTFTVELGVSVHLWGPPLRGLAHVDWWVISFDVPINGGGSPSPQATTLADWPTFARTSLPQNTSPCRARAAGGLQSIVTTTTAAGAAGETIWLFSGDTLALTTETVIPASQVLIDGPATVTLAGQPVSVYPLASGTTVAVTHEIRVAAWAGATWQPGSPMPAGIDVSGWGWATVAGNLPAALWGTRGSQAQEPAPDSPATVAAVTGVTGTGQAVPGKSLTVQLAGVLISPLTARGLALGARPAGTPGQAPAGDTRTRVAATIDDPTVMALRGQVLTVAASSGLRAALADGPLPLLAAETYAVLTSQPMLGPPGTTGPRGTAVTPAGSAGPVPAGTGSQTADSGSPAADPGSPAAAGTALRALFHRAARTHAAVADRWSTSGEALVLTAAGPAAGVIPPGATAVWDLPGESPRTVPCEASVPLWVVTLDAAQRPAQALVPPRSGGGQAVPAGATRVAVTALAAGGSGGAGADGGHAGRGRAAGWHGAGELRQIASQALLGEGAVVRPQSPAWLPRRRSRRGSRGYRELGVTTGREMVERMWTQGAGGRVHRGWIETCLPAWCRAVVVGLVPEDGRGGGDGTPAPLVTTRRSAGGASRPAAGEPAAATLGGTARGGGTFWLLPVPGDAASGAADPPAAGGQLIVRATAPDGWRLDGVVGLETAPGTVTSWPPVTGAWWE